MNKNILLDSVKNYQPMKNQLPLVPCLFFSARQIKRLHSEDETIISFELSFIVVNQVLFADHI